MDTARVVGGDGARDGCFLDLNSSRSGVKRSYGEGAVSTPFPFLFVRLSLERRGDPFLSRTVDAADEERKL